MVVMREMWKTNIMSKKQKQNHANRSYRKRKTAIEIKKVIFVLLTKMLVLIYIHLEIKPTAKVMIGSIFRILQIHR